MTKEKEKKIKQTNSAETANTVKLILTVFAAFVTALVFRRSAGILAMTPLAFIICSLAAFIGIKPSLKALIFGISVFLFNTVEQDDMKITLLYTALCLLACLIFDWGARHIKKKRSKGITILCIGEILCITLSFLLIGNPINAMNAKDVIEDYTGKKYPESENTALGEFEFSHIYYNFETKAYCVDAVSSKYPTEGGTVSLGGGKISDSFESIMKEKISEPYILEITALLRKYFPNENFSVNCEKITSLPNESILSAKEGELKDKLVFEIYLGGVQTANTMTEKVEKYKKIIDESEICYAQIIFKSGTGSWFRRSVTVEPSDIGYDDFTIQRVPAGTSNFFNRCLTELITVD